jgi:3-dehydroquinate synthase
MTLQESKISDESDAKKAGLVSDLKRAYSVDIVQKLLGGGSYRLAEALNKRRALIVTTPTVHRLYGAAMRTVIETHKLSAQCVVVECKESTKTLETVATVCRLTQLHDLDRHAVLVAFGGGVCSDIVTLAASLTRRGIAHIRIPTTLIGQVDAGIGLKGGVNFNDAKNYLGCFYPPESVLVDPQFLHTLDERKIRQGLAEIIKAAIVRDRDLFEMIEHHCCTLVATRFAEPYHAALKILERSIVLMLDELQSNPHEDKTLERLMDMGHTFSPKLETASRFSLPHGEAVAIDMALSCLISAEAGWMDEPETNRLIQTLIRVGLPIDSPLLTKDLCLDALEAAKLHRGGKLNLVVPTKIGKARFIHDLDEVPTGVMESALSRLVRSRSKDFQL